MSDKLKNIISKLKEMKKSFAAGAPGLQSAGATGTGALAKPGGATDAMRSLKNKINKLKQGRSNFSKQKKKLEPEMNTRPQIGFKMMNGPRLSGGNKGSESDV